MSERARGRGRDMENGGMERKENFTTPTFHIQLFGAE